jgi:SAM-dependent methyltransferase
MEEALVKSIREVEPHHWWFQARRTIARDFIRDQILPRLDLGDKAPKILDIGAGTGFMAESLTDFGDVDALEFDATSLEALRAEGKKVLMIGDGLNDAGALSLAHASMAPGGAMDVSQSASDAVYSGKGLGAILTTLDTSRRARSIMLQNFGLAALYNLIAVPIAVAGFASPLVAAIAMSASSLIVTLNALRQNVPAKA